MDTVVFSVFDEEIKEQLRKTQEYWMANNIIVPVPKPGDKVSFPVACVTGVCFDRPGSGAIERWNNVLCRVECWVKNQWHPTTVSVQHFNTVTVVEEPKTEPVWKDCNFIEAVEWMKKHRGESVARWEGREYWMVETPAAIFREGDCARLYDVAGGEEVNFILGKWQIKVSG